MMAMLLNLAMIMMCTTHCAANSVATHETAALADEDVPDDQVALLQGQVELKKGEAKAKQAEQVAKEEVHAGSSYESATSCPGKVAPAAEPSAPELMKKQQKEEVKVETSSFEMEVQTKDTDSRFTLSSVLQVMALLLILDVLRRSPWKSQNGSEFEESSEADSKSPLRSDTAPSLLTVVLAADVAAFEAQIDSWGSQLTQIDSWGCTPLHYAAKGGSARIIKGLVDLGARVNALDAWDETPLHLAARAGHVAACDALIAADALIDSTNAEDCPPLVVAGRAEHEAVCRLLIEHGAGLAGLANEMVPEMVATLLVAQSADQEAEALRFGLLQ